MKNKLLVSIASLLTAPMIVSAEPASRISSYSIPQEYTSLRALGMGNAFTAVADDHSAILYNPAALARRKDGIVRMGMAGGISDDMFSFADDVSKASSNGSGDEVSDVMDVLSDNFGRTFHFNIPKLYGIWARKNWSVAFIPLETKADFNIENSAGMPAINMNMTTDTTLAYAYARNVNWFKDWFGTEGQLSAGITAKLMHRIYVGEVISAAKIVSNDGDLFSTDDAAEGLTVDADLGLLFTPKISSKGWLSVFRAARPTFSVVLRNALDMGFTTNLHLISEDSKEPPTLGRRIDFGSKWDLPNFWVFDPRLAIDIRDVLHENWSLKKGTHVGAELVWKMFNWWKGSWTMGMNQGYYTFGVGARLSWFQIDLVTYGEEVGTSADPIENRRYMMEMSIEF